MSYDRLFWTTNHLSSLLPTLHDLPLWPILKLGSWINFELLDIKAQATWPRFKLLKKKNIFMDGRISGEFVVIAEEIFYIYFYKENIFLSSLSN